MKRKALFMSGIAVIIILSFAAYRSYMKYRLVINMESDSIDLVDKDLLYRLRPNLRNARLVVPGCPHDGDFKKKIRHKKRVFFCNTNAQGFRGTEDLGDKLPGESRIFFIGDSMTFSWGVDDGYSFEYLLQKMFRDRLPSRRVTVVNAGVPGYNSEQYLKNLAVHIIKYKPDVASFMIAGSLLGRNTEEMVTSYSSLLDEIYTYCGRAGIKLLLIYPPVSTFESRPETRLFHQAFLDFTGSRDVSFVDFYDIFNKLPKRDGIVFRKNGDVQSIVHIDAAGIENTVFEVKVSPREWDEMQKKRNYLHSSLLKYYDHSPYNEPYFFDGGHTEEKGCAVQAEYLYPVLEKILEESNFIKEDKI